MATRKGGLRTALLFRPPHTTLIVSLFFETCCGKCGGCFTLSGPIGDVGGRMPLPMSVAFCEI
ncbi:hypothetical protein ACQKWADRAFT_298629 [Trichoderma austrokoningii]